MKAPWSKQPQPPTLTERLKDNSRHLALIGAGVVAIIGVGGALRRKRKGSPESPVAAPENEPAPPESPVAAPEAESASAEQAPDAAAPAEPQKEAG